MKSKTKTYLLIAAVLGVWGTIAYKIWNGLNPDEAAIQSTVQATAFNPKKAQERDTFSIAVLDRDPFLGTMRNMDNKSKKTNTAKPKIVQFPNVVFKGIVKKESDKKTLYVIDIDNTQYLMSLGQSVNGLKLIRGNEDEIKMSMKGESTVIKRN